MLNNIKHKGFTLLELLIVMALSSIIILGVFQGYFVFKKIIANYFQAVRLQNNIKLITHELYNIKDKAGNFGCATTRLPMYLHLSKNIAPSLLHWLNISDQTLHGLTWFKNTDIKIKVLLPQAMYARLKADSEIIYALQVLPHKSQPNKLAYRVYADCQDVYILSNQDAIDYFIQSNQVAYIGDLSLDLYFVAHNKRKNNQDHPIYSFYRYNHQLGTQEILEGVESIGLDAKNKNKINVLVNSVEGNPPLKQWLTVAI